MDKKEWPNKRIKALRVRMGLSQTQFGEIVGVSRGAVAWWEAGARVPWSKHIAAMAALEREHELSNGRV